MITELIPCSFFFFILHELIATKEIFTGLCNKRQNSRYSQMQILVTQIVARPGTQTKGKLGLLESDPNNVT